MARRTTGRSTTMTDVARQAGVSQTTVSLVLNNVPTANIPEETRERILLAVKQLGYRPNAAARLMRTSRSNTIGLITDDIVTTPFAGQVIKGAQDAAWAQGRLLLLVNTGMNPEIERAAIEVMLERQVEGLIYATWYHRPAEPQPALRELPAVLLDCFVEDRSLPSVVPDEVGGGYAATEVLLRKGHRRIGFINHSEVQPAAHGRLLGYRQALAAYGVPFDETLIYTVFAGSQSGYRAAMDLMRLPNPPTALFCYNDRTAMGVYDALRKLGLSIPGDVAVMGYDNQEIIAAHLYPPLSTMQLPHYEMGVWAVNYLLQPHDPYAAPVQQLLPCPYIERESI